MYRTIPAIEWTDFLSRAKGAGLTLTDRILSETRRSPWVIPSRWVEPTGGSGGLWAKCRNGLVEFEKFGFRVNAHATLHLVESHFSVTVVDECGESLAHEVWMWGDSLGQEPPWGPDNSGSDTEG